MTEDDLLTKLANEIRAGFPFLPMPEIQFDCRAVFEENPDADFATLTDLARQKVMASLDSADDESPAIASLRGTFGFYGVGVGG